MLILLALIFYTGFRDERFVADYSLYKAMFENDSVLVEPTFLFFRFFIRNCLGNNVLFLFFIYAIISISLKFKIIKELSDFYFISLVVFVGDLFLLQDFTQIRAAVATSLLLFSIKPLYERNLSRFLLYIVIALLFHVSAVLMLFLWNLNPYTLNKRKVLLFIVVGYLFAICRFDLIALVGYIPIPYIQEKYLLYKVTQEGYTTNIFSVFYLFKILYFLFLLWKIDLIAKNNKYAFLLMKVFCVSLVSLTLFSQNMAAGLRISELFGIVNIVLFPMILYIVKPAFAIKMLLCLVFCGILWMRIYYMNLIIVEI